MQSPSMSPEESAAFALRIFELSEDRRKAAEILNVRHPIRSRHTPFVRGMALIAIGVGAGMTEYAGLGTHYPEWGLIYLYLVSTVGCITGIAALMRAMENGRRLDAVATLILKHNSELEKSSKG